MRSSPRARAAFLLLYGVLLAWQVDRWCFTPHGLASTWPARHDGRHASAASPRGLSQTFTMGADGLDGVWLRPRGAAGTPLGELVVDLLSLSGRTPVRVERVAIAAAQVAGAGSVRVPFRAIRHSRGRSYRLEIRHMHPGDGPAIDLAVSRADALRGGQLLADGVEQWGDLVFETASRRATLPYWIHEVLRPWPAWVRSWPAIAVTLLAFNLVLAWACAVATGLTGAVQTAVPGAVGDPGRPDTAQARGAVSRVALAVAWLIAVAGVVVTAVPTGRYRALDLIDGLPEARIGTTWGTLHGSISPEPVVFDARIHRGVVAMPPSTIAWLIDVPRGAVLRLGAAMRQDMWDRESDGIEMRVHIDHAGGRTTAAALTIYPMGVVAHRRLFPLEIPLHLWAGQRITLVLETTPERAGNAVNDVPVWTDPRIEWERHPAAGEARVVTP